MFFIFARLFAAPVALLFLDPAFRCRSSYVQHACEMFRVNGAAGFTAGLFALIVYLPNS